MKSKQRFYLLALVFSLFFSIPAQACYQCWNCNQYNKVVENKSECGDKHCKNAYGQCVPTCSLDIIQLKNNKYKCKYYKVY